MLNDIALKDLRALLGNRFLEPSTPAYEAACEIWNAAARRKPLAIAKCRSGDDVAAAVKSATTAGLAVSVRGGGHNIAGTALADGALTIDLTEMRDITIDAKNHLAHVGGGATWAELDAAAQEHGLATPGGVVSTTGVAGLTLGGGFGWLARLHGLAADNLISAKLVLADGRKVTASETQHADLFWAIRGGGGNFGVATQLTFRLHALAPQVLFGPTFFALEDAETVLNAYARHAPNLPRAGCVWANLMTAPPAPVLPKDRHGTKVLTLMQFFAGPEDIGRDHLQNLYGGVTPLGDGVMMRPFVEAQQFLDPTYPFGARNYWRAHNHAALSPALISCLVDLAADLPTPESELLICHLGGAISDKATGDTAYPHRAVPFMSTPGVRWHDAGDDARMVDWLKAASARIAEHADPGAYVNFVAERAGREDEAYGQNMARLAKIKQTYDPGNLFRVNQNVKPKD